MDPVSTLAPVFVMGSHRSGTTWLYQLLAAQRDFDAFRAHHVFRYPRTAKADAELQRKLDRYEVSVLFATRSLTGFSRCVDDIVVSPELPEEYGYVLTNAGSSPNVTSKNLALFEQIVRDVQSAPNRPVVLKNAWDYSNFLFLHRSFPNARFVFIHRHPVRVVHSLLTAFRRALASRIPYLAALSPRYAERFAPGLFARMRRALSRVCVGERFGARIASAALARAHRYYLRNIPALPEGSWIAVRYEDLCARPKEVLAQILSFLQRDAAAVELSTPATPRSHPLLPEVARLQHGIARSHAKYMALHGYRADEL